MALKDILNFFSPKDKTFFPLFDQATHKLTKLSEFLHEATNATKEDREVYFNKIDELEEHIEQISHTMNLELSKNFITPFDREDIHALASAIDDVADYIHGTANRIMMYKIEKFPETIHKLSELTIEACLELEKAVKELRNMKNIRTLTDAFIRINSIENQADYIFDKAIGDLFDSETNALEVIKQKEILSALETATDKAEDAANVIESIIIKYV